MQDATSVARITWNNHCTTNSTFWMK